MAPYWVPSFDEQRNPSFDALKGEFRQLLQDAVAAQLDGSKPACFLSGGTDSSTVAGMIGLASGKAATRYSIGFDAQGYDEMEYARLAARHFKTEHHEYYVTPDDLVRSIPTVAAHFDQPFGNSSALPSYYCAKMARDDGVTKILGGDGGDELFGGNSRYAKQRVFGWYQPCARGCCKKGCWSRCWAPGPAAAFGLDPQGQQLRGAGQRADARPASDVQPDHAPGRRRSAHAALPGPGRHRQPRCNSSARCGRWHKTAAT